MKIKFSHIKKYRRLKKWVHNLLLFCLVFLIANCGVFFDSLHPVDEPASVNAGDTMTVVLHTRYESYGDKLGLHLVAGLLAPKSWNAGANAKVYFTSTITGGIQAMSLVPSTEIPTGSNGLNWPDAVKAKYGFGSNVLNDLEWIVFWSDNTFDIHANQFPTADITIKVKTGQDNLQYKRGYFLSESVDAFNTSQFSSWQFVQAFFTNCFIVNNGTGDLVDFCYPQIGAGEPSNALVDDLVTIKYDGDLDTSNLKNAGDIYLCAKAFTTSGDIVTVCSQEPKAKMISWGVHKWRSDIWPRKYFHLSEGQSLTRIEYFFTDQTGTIKTGYANTAAPFVFKFKCK